jgi:hypothetical protein
METYMQVWQKMLKLVTIYGPICGYCNGCLKNHLLYLYASIAIKKTNNYLQDLYTGFVMDVKWPLTIYKTYMWVLHIWNGFMEIIIKRMQVLHNVHFDLCKP